MQPTFLITGDYQHSDFSEALKSLEGISIELPSERLWGLTETNKANLKLVVIGETSRGQVTREFVESIRDEIPLARILILQNDWCTGKKLPEQIFPGVTYCHVNQWAAWFQQHIVAESSGSVIFDLPPTANQVDQQQFLVENTRPELLKLKFGVIANYFAEFDAISQAVSQLGGTAVWMVEEKEEEPTRHKMTHVDCRKNFDCLIVNSTTNGVDFHSIKQTRNKIGSIPIVLISNFPRQIDREQAIDEGIFEFVSQPFLLDQLQFAVQSAIARHQSPTVEVASAR